jgi:signal transduction histidine kinase
MIRDVSSERARTAEELEKGAAKSVCDLAAGVAHEIGNPLNAISLNLQLLERDPSDREAIDICKSQIRRLDGIIRSFLGALRPVKPCLVPGSLAEPLKNCLAAFKGQFEDRRIKVTLDVPAAMPPVALDKDKMEQVFFNLVKNALEAMKDGGSLDIDLSVDDRDVTVTFRDSGLGMSGEQLAHLFEPYRTTKEHGTGLGLMISARIVRDHGGTIAARSKEGDGTVFTVSLPRLEKRVRALK